LVLGKGDVRRPADALPERRVRTHVSLRELGPQFDHCLPVRHRPTPPQKRIKNDRPERSPRQAGSAKGCARGLGPGRFPRSNRIKKTKKTKKTTHTPSRHYDTNAHVATGYAFRSTAPMQRPQSAGTFNQTADGGASDTPRLTGGRSGASVRV